MHKKTLNTKDDSQGSITTLRYFTYSNLTRNTLKRQSPKSLQELTQGDGLAEKWEASQSADTSNCKPQELSSSDRYFDLTDDSSLLVQAMELSGPRPKHDKERFQQSNSHANLYNQTIDDAPKNCNISFFLGGVDGDPVLRGTRIRATWECVSLVERWATGNEWYLEICRGDQETLGTSGGVLLPKTKLDQSRLNPGIVNQ
ncbi:hypothetical protein JHK85_028273 [Glycine max]|nr:hypothetical protein JHK85_028273 [Glycine max]